MADEVGEPTVRALLERQELGLRLVVDGEPGRLDQHVPWIHSSDLIDPTPFMSAGLVLLTTGTQFLDWDEDDPRFSQYVERLDDCRVTAVGFGTDVASKETPHALIAACAMRGVTVFEVPYDTPFIALVHANAEAVTSAEYGRRMWALEAQAAISRGALQPDGLSAVVAELSGQLDSWVGLYDDTGTLVRQQPARDPEDPLLDLVSAEAIELLRRGARAAATVRIGDDVMSMQTLGGANRLDGVLAVGTGELDHEARSVVTSVVAMAGLALEQNESIRRAWRQLRAGVLRALIEQRPGLAKRIANDAWGGLPVAPLVVAVSPLPEGADHVGWLNRRSGAPGHVFHAVADGDVIIIMGAAYVGLLTDYAAFFDVGVGVSAEAGYEAIESALAQARIAKNRGRPGVTTFADATEGGLLDVLARGEGPAIASAALAPLVAYDRENDAALVPTLRAWLENDGSHEATGRALGVHRHTVRARIERIGTTLGRDLESFPVRAELWAALQIGAAAPAGYARSSMAHGEP
jgi:purine catabolism regulator